MSALSDLVKMSNNKAVQDELAAKDKRIKNLEDALGIYANHDNWKSVRGVMQFQTMGTPWGYAEPLLRTGLNSPERGDK